MKKIILIGILFFTCISGFAQEKYSDKEIGFDRETIIKELGDDSKKMDDKQIESYLKTRRDDLIIIYDNRRKNSEKARIPIANTGCQNMDFSQNSLVGWTYHWSKGNYSQRPSNDDDADSAPSTTTGNVINDNLGEPRFQVLSGNIFDVNLGQQVNPNNGNVLLLGRREEVLPTNDYADRGQEEASKSFTLSNDNAVLQYSYAIVFENPNHGGENTFDVIIEKVVNGQAQTLGGCSSVNYTFSNSPGFIASSNPATGASSDRVRRWSTNVIDLLSFPGVVLGDEIRISFRNRDCSAGGHGSYAYVSAQCLSKDSSIDAESQSGLFCIEEPITFTSTAETFPTDTLTWEINQNGSSIANYSGNTATHTFSEPGDYTVTFTVNRPNTCPFTYSLDITIAQCDCSECENCNSFAPNPGEKYVVSAWVKENFSQQQITYANTAVRIVFLNDNSTIGLPVSFIPSGDIIDGWQRIIGEFTIPSGTTNISLDLVNSNGQITAYFDDVRVHPFNGNMKSFVYDQKTQQLMAELDENNYATFYEYDKEGGLIRVKKETKDGVYTIQETRSGNAKNN